MMQNVSPGPILQFRANTQAREYLPLSVRSVGHYRVGINWREHFDARWFLQLFWVREGRGRFYVGKRMFEAQRSDIFIYPPGSPHRIESSSSRWEYCWITFDHADCVQWLKGFGLSANLQSAGPCPVKRFEAIAQALAQGTRQNECQAAQEAHALLIEAASSKSTSSNDEGIAHAKSFMDENFSDSELSVESLAEKLNMHRTTLYRLFRMQYGLPPKQYLKNLRLHRALYLIRQSRYPIDEIARLSGYTDPNYLSRLVKTTVGLSARRIRSTRCT